MRNGEWYKRKRPSPMISYGAGVFGNTIVSAGTGAEMRRRPKLGGTHKRLLIAACVVLGCQSGDHADLETKSTVPNRDIKTVMEAHSERLMAIPGVVGVAIGETSAGVPCIQVLVVEKTRELARRIPQSLEGHPVVTRETGEIKALDETQD